MQSHPFCSAARRPGSRPPGSERQARLSLVIIPASAADFTFTTLTVLLLPSFATRYEYTLFNGHDASLADFTFTISAYVDRLARTLSSVPLQPSFTT